VNVLRFLLCFTILLSFQCFTATQKGTNFGNYKKSYSVKSYSKKSQQLKGGVQNQKDFILVPTILVGRKLERYFTGTSTAVVVMNCCKQAHVHRKCLQMMFHADQHQCSHACPTCHKTVDRKLFAQSRPNYLTGEQRKQFCDFCHQTLSVRNCSNITKNKR